MLLEKFIFIFIFSFLDSLTKCMSHRTGLGLEPTLSPFVADTSTDVVTLVSRIAVVVRSVLVRGFQLLPFQLLLLHLAFHLPTFRLIIKSLFQLHGVHYQPPLLRSVSYLVQFLLFYYHFRRGGYYW